MSAARPAEILRQLEHTGVPESELLVRFRATRDGAAFAELVRRHGALVLGVCRRVTGHAQDAEDAFQATFLVLAQKAASVRSGMPLGNYLYGIAFRVARRAKRSALRRRVREVTVPVLPERLSPEPPEPMPELAPILDEELEALAVVHRDAIVLCDLQGASREEAAATLGIPEGTLSSRLANGRKKLAARLTKRGVSLSGAALSMAVAEANAGTTVSTELVTRICGLATDFAATGAVPRPLARLTKKEFVVRKTLVFGMLIVVAVAGAVYATVPRDEAPPTDPPSIVAQKAETVPQPKIEPKPGAVLAFTGNPRLAAGWDLPVSGVPYPAWSSTGTQLVVSGIEPRTDNKNRRPLVLLIKYPAEKANRPQPVGAHLGKFARFVGFSPDGKQLVTDMREYDMLSGYHQLHFWNSAKTPNAIEVKWPEGDWIMPALERDQQRTLDFEGRGLYGYAFPSDGKTFRTVRSTPAATPGDAPRIEVVEIDTLTGKTGKTLLTLNGVSHALSPDGARLAAFDKGATKVTVYDVGRGAKLSECAFPEIKGSSVNSTDPPSDPPAPGFSPDGKRLVVSHKIGRAMVINTDTGEPLPALEGTKHARVSFPNTHAFTGDGRLLAATCIQFAPPERDGQVGWGWKGTDLTVWDTQTGKVLKAWDMGNDRRPSYSPIPAFNPVRPVLAVLEPNGANETRVGFWDFTAEIEKK